MATTMMATAAALTVLSFLHWPTFCSAFPFDPLHMWSLPPPNNSLPSAGYPMLDPRAVVHHRVYFSNTSSPTSNFTYNHHAHVFAENSLVLVSWSNGLVDEDADGQRCRYTISRDGGQTFNQQTILFPSPLAAGQHARAKNNSGLERAMCSEGFLSVNNRLYAIVELYGRGVGLGAVGFGRAGRLVNPSDGNLIGDVCWIQQSPFAYLLAATPYDATHTPFCADAADLTARLADPPHQPAWSYALMTDTTQVYAADGTQLCEPTHSFAINDYHCRLWRTCSGSGRQAAINYAECIPLASEGREWFNGTDMTQTQRGLESGVVPTNVADTGSKSFLGYVTLSDRMAVYVINNPKTNGQRFPLTIALGDSNGTLYDHILTIRTNVTALRYPGLYKNVGWAYPHAQQLNDRLFVAYSLNKEDVYVTAIDTQYLSKLYAETQTFRR